MKWVRRIFCGFFSVIMAIGLISGTALAAAPETSVYVASAGECYHREDCAYLKSKNEMTLAEAVAAGYRPCSRCDPPVLDADETEEVEASTEPSAELSAQPDEATVQSDTPQETEIQSNETQEAELQSAAPQEAEASAESAGKWKLLFICAASAAGVLAIIVVAQTVKGKRAKRGKRQKASFTLPISRGTEDVPEHIKEELETGQWREINSNLISRIRYEDGKLFVKFSTDEMYCYFDVPEQVFRNWCFDRFPTMFFQEEIKPHFAFVRVDEPE